MKASTLIGLPLELLLGSFGPIGIQLVLVNFTVDVLFYGAFLCYSCQNKCQNALF